MTNKIILTEKTWKLTPIKDLHKINKRNRSVWLFKCDCGKETEAAPSDVKQGRRKSCGCGVYNQKGPTPKANKAGPINKLFGNYMRAAEKRNYPWQLTIEEFKEFIFCNCYYCDTKPATEICIARKKTKENTLIYNGIDRKDNLLGYTKNNCITACFTCNRMKMNLSYNEFMLKIKSIYENLPEQKFSKTA